MKRFHGQHGKWFRYSNGFASVSVSRIAHRNGAVSLRITGAGRGDYASITLPLGEFLREVGVTLEQCRAALEDNGGP